MKNNLKLLFLFVSFLTLTSCIEEDHFGESDSANIKKIMVSNQSGPAIINANEATVIVEIPGGVDLSEIVIQSLELSSFATSSIQPGDIVDLNQDVSITLTSENGTSRVWTLTAFVASSTPQLDNGNLNQWYQTATEYYEPGQSAASTIWGTGNRGTQLLNKLATYPKDLGNGNLAAQMETLSNGPLGSIFGTPISAGSLFTGYFNPDNIDPANPEAAVEFGTPFAGRPSKIRLKYSYEAGAVNKSKTGEVLNYSDAADIYALLEVRLNGVEKRLATAWFRTENDQVGLMTIEIPFTYGTLDSSFPEYTNPANGLFVENDQVDYILPTHITFVATSSFDGAKFNGAVGSKLVVDDIELIYE